MDIVACVRDCSVSFLCLVFNIVFVRLVSSSNEVCDQILSCSDWSTVRICAPSVEDGQLRLLKSVKCPSYSPYCDRRTGHCSQFQSDNVEVNGFVCMKDGVFPDPWSCRNFHVCQDLQPYSYKCALPGHVFDTFSGTCVRQYYCQSAFSKCLGLKARLIPHPSNDRFFIYCHDQAPLFINSCEGEDTFDVHFQSCRPICKKPGTMIDSTNSSRYHLCSVESHSIFHTQYSIRTFDCPLGYAYSKPFNGCVIVDHAVRTIPDHTSKENVPNDTILPVDNPDSKIASPHDGSPYVRDEEPVTPVSSKQSTRANTAVPSTFSTTTQVSSTSKAPQNLQISSSPETIAKVEPMIS